MNMRAVKKVRYANEYSEKLRYVNQAGEKAKYANDVSKFKTLSESSLT